MELCSNKDTTKTNKKTKGEEEAYVGTTIVKVLRPTHGMNE